MPPIPSLVRKMIRIFLKTFVLLLLVFIPLSFFLLNTQKGLDVDLFLLKKISGNRLSVKKAEGALLNDLSLSDVTYRSPEFDLSVKTLTLSWSLIKSLTQGAKIHNLVLEEVILRSKKTTQKKKKRTLPFATRNALKTALSQYFDTIKNLKFNLAHVQIKKFIYHSSSNEEVLGALIISAQSDGKVLLINDSQLILDNQRITLKGKIEIDKKINTHLVLKGEGAVDVISTLTGNETAFNLTTIVNKPIKAKAVIELDNHFDINALFTQAENKLRLTSRKHSALNIAFSLPSLSKLSPAFSAFHAGLTGQGELGEKSHFHLTLTPGFITFEDKKPLPFKGGLLELFLIKKALNAKGHFGLTDNNTVSIQMTFPDFDPLSLEEQVILGALALNFDDIGLMDTYITDIKNTHGNLRGSVKINHLLSDPHYFFDINLENGQTHIKSISLDLEKINLNLKGTLSNTAVTGSLASDQGDLTLKGKTAYQNNHFISDIQIQGNNMNLLNTSEYKIYASPTLSLLTDNKNILLNGKIAITSAKLTPSDFSSTIELPEEVIVVDEKTNDENSFAFGYELTLDLGEQTEFAIEGLKGKVKGSLLLTAPINQAFRAAGDINIVDGTYKAYGQDLKITQGKFMYAGGPLNNPGIFIQASRSFDTNTQYTTDFDQSFSDEDNKVTVGLTIKGRLKSPKSELFSVPSSRSQSDILSMLLLGKPISQASDEGSDSAFSSSQLLISAISKLNLGGGLNGQQLTEQLKHTFGIDELNLENQSAYDSNTDTVTDNTALVIGKSLSSKLSMHYSMGLSQNTNILKIKYQVTPRWAIQTETNGNTNGVDIIYNYHK